MTGPHRASGQEPPTLSAARGSSSDSTRNGDDRLAARGGRVPLIDLQAQYAPIRDEVMAAIARVCDSQRFILGTEVEQLESELRAMLEVKHAIGVSSGTDALLVALMALGVGHGDEVITSAFSFFATVGSIVRLGARPVLVDIDPATYNIDPGLVADAVTPRTKAIVPVHLFGLSADLGPLLEIATGANAAVVEDAAQAIGARYRGRPVGGLGTFGCFSFFPTKNLGAFGDGGLVTTEDDQLAHRVRLLRNHGSAEKYVYRSIGGNFRLDAIQAAVLRVKLPHLARWTEARRRNAVRYGELFEEAGLARTVRLPVEFPARFHVYNQFVVRAPDRDALRAHLASEGIETAVYYPVPLHEQDVLREMGSGRGSFPHAEAAAREVVALPIYGELSVEQQQRVVRSIASFFARRPRGTTSASMAVGRRTTGTQ